MPRIGLSDTWTPIPKGVHVFKITKVVYKEKFGKLDITMKTASGQTHTERYNLIGKNHEPNQGALNAFSYFARAALNDFGAQDIDPDDLVGHYIRCTVDHEEVPGKDDPEKIYKFVRLEDKEPADGFDEPESDEPSLETSAAGPDAQKTSGKPSFDLDALLG